MFAGRTILLLGLTIVCAMAVVDVRYQARTLVKNLEKVRLQEQQLQVEWGAKQVQQVAVAKNDHIAKQVSKQNMQHVNPSMTYYMTPTKPHTKGMQ